MNFEEGHLFRAPAVLTKMNDEDIICQILIERLGTEQNPVPYNAGGGRILNDFDTP